MNLSGCTVCGIAFCYEVLNLQTIEQALNKLSKSNFRSSFHLNAEQVRYVHEKGIDKIRTHAEDFVHTRLAPSSIPNDGRQTPMKGHPVFISQHACACCCRGCLNKWYKVPKGIALTPVQEAKIVNLIIAWIEREVT
ncbi:MAG: DUF4186 domain-containing protein [Ruminococcus sp.]|nr:DUF4186 domain-containing protein [Ruminococcus sp.]